MEFISFIASFASFLCVCDVIVFNKTCVRDKNTMCKSNVSALTIIVRDRAEQWVCPPALHYCGFSPENDGVKERKLAMSNKLHWVKTSEKKAKST